MYAKTIIWFGKAHTLACDGKCNKAWGVNNRPKISFDENDPDDVAYLADDELGEAPADPGTYEGGHAKPDSPREQNKWCARECERSRVFLQLDKPLPNYSGRVYNQPWKHGTKPAASAG